MYNIIRTYTRANGAHTTPPKFADHYIHLDDGVSQLDLNYLSRRIVFYFLFRSASQWLSVRGCIFNYSDRACVILCSWFSVARTCALTPVRLRRPYGTRRYWRLCLPHRAFGQTASGILKVRGVVTAEYADTVWPNCTGLLIECDIVNISGSQPKKVQDLKKS